MKSRKIYEGDSKSSKLILKRIALAEHFCCCKTLPLLVKQEKLIQISF